MAIQGVSGMSIPIQPDFVSRGRALSSTQEASSENAGGRPEKSESKAQGPRDLTPEEQRQVKQLEQIDRRVRAHEQAHVVVGGDLVKGGATFTYTTGPDDQRYAVAGEVAIDTSPGRTPKETIPKAQHIRETALAPADPSPQDRSVAAKATKMEGDARREVAVLQQREMENKKNREGAGSYLDVERSDRPSLGDRLSVFA